ncbi:MAG TPA: AsmA-like C-terminal region-containing protein [Candidatus Acidoferrum sp.]|nr:AsmA-like C-terminal region-containing protein [Candidatus Acidoferrum sp.]
MPTALSDPIAPAEPPIAAPRAGWRRWPKAILVLLAVLWLADAGISLLIQHTALKRRLTSRLEAAFGRPVDVGSYRFSLWSGPMLEANSVVVAEDSRFGEEYFLRAESLAVHIRWQSLLSGHVELGTLSLTRPSLNLVRGANGDWNLAEWLPRPAGSGTLSSGSTARAAASAIRFRRIDVSGGRINFKLEAEKLPFAFVDVNGTVENENVDRWRLDLFAIPSRAAVIVQQPGLLHLAGHFGGTSSRLRPASLEFDWDSASITDVLRLLRGRDYGLRGDFDLSIAARTEADSWSMEGKAALAKLHRWDLALRPDNPSVNILAKGQLDPQGSRLELTSARIEAPRSNLAILGALDWTPPGPNLRGTQLHVVSSGLSLGDVLAWARAFDANVSDKLAVAGSARVDLNLGGWPPHLETASLDLPRAELSGNRLPTPLRAGPLSLRYDAKGISLSPTPLVFGSSANSFRIDAAAKRDVSEFSMHIQGAASQVQDITSVAAELGWNLGRGWEIAGPVRCDLHWQAALRPWRSVVAGNIDWGSAAAGVSLHAPFLNLPVEQIRGRADLKPGATHVALTSAQAFGTRWSGTLDHDLGDGWRFALATDELSTTDLDRWLNPRWRESFLDRILPFFSSRSVLNASPPLVRARGKLAIDGFTFAPFTIRGLRTDLSLDGRRLEFSNLAAQFEGGDLAGSVEANLESPPVYTTSLEFSGVNLQTFSAAFPSLAGTFAGSASAKIVFHASGASRSDLLQSLECRGNGSVSQASVDAIDLTDSLESQTARPGTASFHNVSAEFMCARGSIEFQKLSLVGSGAAWEGAGTVDYSRNLDLRLRPVPTGSVGPRVERAPAPPADEYRISGPLNSPRIVRVAAPVHTAEAKR